MQQTTRELLEREFASKNESPTPPEVVSDESIFAEAPQSYGIEIRQIFKQLPLEMRKYLCERENSISKEIARLSQSAQEHGFIDDEFNTKGCKRGFKTAKDWIKNLINAEDIIEAKPELALRFLAGVYGISLEKQSAEGELLRLGVQNFSAINMIFQKLEVLTDEFSKMRELFELKIKNEAELLAKAEEAKAARDAAFSVCGHRNSDSEGQPLTTRQMLERQFASLEH